jgi:hypothetical protein
MSGLICSVCHREDFNTGFDVAVQKIRSSSLKTTKVPVRNVVLCEDCYGKLDLDPHDGVVGSSSGVEPEPQPPVGVVAPGEELGQEEQGAEDEDEATRQGP